MYSADTNTAGHVHSIESMGLLDGPGTRTVFFLQGCPLRCVYCHNPDTQSFKGGITLSPKDVLNKVNRYKSYYGDEGGVTFSGGEPLVQGAFLYETLTLLKKNNIGTCVDTSGFGQKAYYSKIFPLVDTMLLDVKAFDNKRFYAVTKSEFDRYVDFIDNLEKNGFAGSLWLRHVMVPGFTDNRRSMEEFIQMITPVKHLVERIEILPYHTSGVKKYMQMGIPYALEGVSPMNPDTAKQFEIYANNIFAESVYQSYKRVKIKKGVINMKNNMRVSTEHNKNELAKIINTLPLFEAISSEDLKYVVQEIKLIDFEPDELIFKSGDSASAMYLIYKGQVKIYYNSVDGREQIFYMYKDGDFVGGLNLLERSSYLYMGQALTDCKVIEIPKKIFNEYFVKCPIILQSILHKSFERIRWAENLIQTLATNNASMKTAALLLRLKNSIGVKTKDGIKLELSMNREELGNYSGLTRESITRKLGEFKELGYIDLIGNKIIFIKEPEILEKLVF